MMYFGSKATIAGIATHKFPYFVFSFFTLVLVVAAFNPAQVFAQTPQSESSTPTGAFHDEPPLNISKLALVRPNQWTTNMLGAWKVTINDSEVHFALWIPDDYRQPGIVLGAVAYEVGSECRYYGGLNLGGMAPPAFDLDRFEGKPTPAHLAYSINFEERIYQGATEAVWQDPRLCPLRFTIASDHDGASPFVVRGPEYYPHSERFYPERISATAELQTLIQDMAPPGRESPSAGEWAMINDKSVRWEDVQSDISVSCSKDRVYAWSVLRKAGYNEISAQPLGNRSVEVTVRPLKSLGTPQRERHKMVDDVDWENLVLIQRASITPKMCLEAKAVLQYLAWREGGSEQAQTATAPATPRLTTLDEVFLVDQHGADRIDQASPSYPGVAKRAFGSTTMFRPGDRTRQILFSELGQRLTIQNEIKSSFKQESESDFALSLKDIRQVAYDQELSEQYDAVIYKSLPAYHQQRECRAWRGDSVRFNNCIAWIEKGTEISPFYITTSKTAATSLFKFLSPNRATWMNIEGGRVGCPNGAFCDLPSGEYLNAIYRGDYDEVKRLDEAAFSGLTGRVDNIAKQNPVAGFLLGIGSERLTLLNFVLNEYMHNYQNNPQSCFKPGAVITEYNDRTPDTVYFQTIQGVEIETMRFEGIERYARYIINPEFKNACNEVCGVRGPEQYQIISDRIFNDGVAGELYAAMRFVPQRYACTAPEIEEFEKQLRLLFAFNKSQERLATWQRNSW